MAVPGSVISVIFGIAPNVFSVESVEFKRTYFKHRSAVQGGSEMNEERYEGDYDAGDDPSQCLWNAAREGDAESITYFLDLGADPSFTDSSDTSPLHCAALGGHWEVVKLLLDAGAAIDAQTNSGRTALAFACGQNLINIVRMLITRGADVDKCDSKGRCPLHFAARGGFDGVIQLLLNQGADINATDEEANTPLHHAAHRNNAGVVRLLISRGANMKLEAADGRTALDCTTDGEVPVRVCGQRNGMVVRQVLLCFDGRAELVLQKAREESAAALQAADIEAVLRVEADSELEAIRATAAAERCTRMQLEGQLIVEMSTCNRAHHARKALEQEQQNATASAPRWTVGINELEMKPVRAAAVAYVWLAWFRGCVELGVGSTARTMLASYLQTLVAARQLLEPASAELMARGVSMAERVSRHKHPDLVQFLGASVAIEHSTMMLFEVMDGDLYSLAELRPDALSMNEVLAVGMPLVRALSMLHSRGLVHGFVSMRRVLLSNCDSVLKGHVKLMWDGAPAASGFGPSDDVFELGVLLCEVAAGGPSACQGIESVEGLLQQVRWPRLRNVLASATHSDASARPLMAELTQILKTLKN